MGKRLVITEKPSVARDIAAALGGFTESEEYLESDEYVITFAVGHLLELAEPQEYDKKWASWAIKNLPIVPDDFKIQPRDGQKKRLDAIKKLAHRADVTGIINACDAGREGELIYRRIAEYCDIDKPLHRLWLQSMTKDAIKQAFKSLRPGKELEPLADAAWCRAVGDWLVGMNATRALTQRLKSRGDREAWSAGRVQTPTLNLLVVREREILAHIPRPYWEIVGSFKHGDQTWDARFWDPEAKAAAKTDDDEEGDPEAKPSRLFDRVRVDRLMAALASAKVGDASEKRKKSKQSPPLLLDLTTLQRDANRRFSFSAKRTLDAAQRLYEGSKLITYPRTDSRHLPGDYAPKIQEVLAGLARATDWRDLANSIAPAPLNLEKLLDDAKVSDHFAIIPTGNVPDGPMRGDDERIFELIVRQFLGALMGPATWSNVERIVAVPAGEETARFRVTSRTLDEPGFLAAIGIPAETVAMPPLQAGKDTAAGVQVGVVEVREEAKETKPPGRYNESQLLRMMETAGERVDEEDLSNVMKGHGLGTPATRADTIEGLVRKNYSRRVDNRLAPTSKAMRLMDILGRLSVGPLTSPKMTGEWEFSLQEVQSGKLSKKKLLDRLTKYTVEMTHSLSKFEHADIYAKDADLGVCPNCKEGKVVESAWGYRCTRNDGEGAACDFIIWKDRAGRYIDRDLAAKLVAEGRANGVQGFVDRSGRSLSGNLVLERDAEKENRWALRVEYGDAPGDTGPEVIGDAVCPCPMHENCEIIETNRRFVCKKVLEGTERSGPVLPKLVCQRELSVEEALPFFDAARTDLIENFISRRGRPFKAFLVRKETGKHGFEFMPRAGEEGKAGEEGAKPSRFAKKSKGKGAVGDEGEVVEKKAKATKSKAKAAKAEGDAPADEKAAKPTKAKAAKGEKAAGKATGKAGKAPAKAVSKATGKGVITGKGAAGIKTGKAAKAAAEAAKTAGDGPSVGKGGSDAPKPGVKVVRGGRPKKTEE